MIEIIFASLSQRGAARASPPRRRAIPTASPKKKTRPLKRRPAAAPRAARATRAAPKRRARPAVADVDHVLGEGVADAHALKRLNVPPQSARSRDPGVREVGWADFGELARDLADRIAGQFRPDVILGIVNGGVFLGGALATPLRAEFHPVRTTKKGRTVLVEPLTDDLKGKSVLVVDDVTVSGGTLGAAVKAARKAGARDLRTATLVVRPDGNHPDFHAIETKDLVVFGWDYQLNDAAPADGDPGDMGV